MPKAKKKRLPVVQILFGAELGPKAKFNQPIAGGLITAYRQTPDVSTAVIDELRAASKGGWNVLFVDCARLYPGPKPRTSRHRAAFEQALRDGVGRVFDCYINETQVPREGSSLPNSLSKKRKK